MYKYFYMILLAACGNESVSTSENRDGKTQDTTVKTQKKETKSESAGHHGSHGANHSMGEVQIGPVPQNAKVFFKSPKDGAKVSSPVSIQMGVEGMTVVPAGPLKDGTGHHHVIIDSPAPKRGTVVPMDEKHVHFGKGQTEASLELSAGTHTLQLQFANGAHISYGEQLGAKIQITVE